MATTADAIVIGGGVHGASIAFHLAKRKMRVVLLEKRFLAAGGTGKSTALVRQHYDNYLESKLTHESWKYFAHWNEMVGGDAGWVQSGFIRTVIPAEVAALKANVAMHQRIGITTQIITAPEVKEIEPGWDVSDMEYAAYEPDSGYADPQMTTLSLADAAKRYGAQILQETAALKINTRDARVLGVTTDQHGEISAPIVALAAGPWTPSLLKPLGLDVPIACERHQVASFIRPPDVAARVCCIDGAREMYFRPEGHNLILVGCGVGAKSIDPDNYNEAIDDEHIEFSAERLSRRIPKMLEGLAQGGWAGFYDMSPDEKCLLGELPVKGLYINAGHSGTGFKTAPAVGLCLSELICDGAAKTVDLAPLRWSRFAEGKHYYDTHPYSTSWHTGHTEHGSKGAREQGRK